MARPFGASRAADEDSLSRTLSRVLRYEARQLGIEQDADGWVLLADLVRSCNLRQTVDEVAQIAERSKGSQGFRFDVDRAGKGVLRVRARYNHKDRPKGSGKGQRGDRSGAEPAKSSGSSGAGWEWSSWRGTNRSSGYDDADASAGWSWSGWNSSGQADATPSTSEAYGGVDAWAGWAPWPDVRANWERPALHESSGAKADSSMKGSEQIASGQAVHEMLSDGRKLRGSRGNGASASSAPTDSTASKNRAEGQHFFIGGEDGKEPAMRQAPKAPERWSQYKDPHSGRQWMCNEDDSSEYFFVDRAQERGWTRYMTADKRTWWSNESSGRFFFEKTVS
eukprot:TRINITY_DN19490_c0_g1_i2.p1 TRINITY_DN19490_c0_g1~~TRINITY_DN19490_c0_g1_i2.p1  ORF type:complete len:337 (-),score=83.95 TRINITY_DN19490_c0_g1_i2:111-1121(-)